MKVYLCVHRISDENGQWERTLFVSTDYDKVKEYWEQWECNNQDQYDSYSVEEWDGEYHKVIDFKETQYE